MDSDGQLVVRIEPTEEVERVPESTEIFYEETDDSNALTLETDTYMSEIGKICCLKNSLVSYKHELFVVNIEGGEQIQFVRPLPGGGFEILSEEEAANFLEVIESDTAEADTEHLLSDKDSPQILITQDEDGQLMVEGTPLQFLLGDNNQQ